jgi:hypothetical protein
MPNHQPNVDRNRNLSLLCAFTPILIVLAVNTLDGVAEWIVLGLLIAFLVACAGWIGADLTRRRS